MKKSKRVEARTVDARLPEWVTKALRGKKLKRAEAGFAPFWTPGKKPRKGNPAHPSRLIGVTSNHRTLPAKKGYKERHAFDVTTDAGDRWCVAIGASLKQQGAEELKPGATVAIEYLGKRRIPGQRNPMEEMALYHD